jgi:hypothetical protein
VVCLVTGRSSGAPGRRCVREDRRASNEAEGCVVLVVLNWVAVGLFVAALVLCCLAWVGRVRFDRWLPRESSRAAGRAFGVLDAGALLQAIAQLVGYGATRWAISSPGFVLVVLGAILVLRLRRKAPEPVS